jgi:hypothetical protein
MRTLERQWWRRRSAQAALMAAKEISGGESMWQGLREFWDEKQNNMGWATIYRFDNISSNS